MSLKRLLGMLGGSGLMLTSLFQGVALAQQATGFNGSYVGSPLSLEQLLPENPAQGSLPIGLGGANAASSNPAAQYQGRLDLPNSSLSLRGDLYLDQQTRAVIPSVTFDLPVNEGVNVYAGGGYALIESGQIAIGNRNGMVLSAGAETEVLPGMVIYSDAKVGLGTHADRNVSPLRLQVGVGRRF